jgi:hypothetical protein
MTTVRGMMDGFPGGVRRSYISTAPFNTVFYTYANNTLTPLPNTYASKCPAGRILRENGKKLFPDSNPGVTQYYVGVYDATTFFNGFIDPNDVHFAIFNSDKPVYVPNNMDFGNSTPDLGPSVYTQGNIIAQLAPDYSNSVGMINSTLSQYNTYGLISFNSSINTPKMEVGNITYGTTASIYLSTISTPIVKAYGQYPYIISQGATANIIATAYSNAYITTSNTVYNNTVQLGATLANTYVAVNSVFTPVIINAYSYTTADIIAGNTFNNGYAQMNATQTNAIVRASNATGYVEMNAAQTKVGLTASNANDSYLLVKTQNNTSGLDGVRGDIYGTGMLNVPNSVGTVTLLGGTVNVGPLTIFTYNPYVFLSYQLIGGTPGTLTYTIAGGILTINSTAGLADSSQVNWFAVYSAPAPS